jgi:hypothetical protein
MGTAAIPLRTHVVAALALCAAVARLWRLGHPDFQPAISPSSSSHAP